MIKATSILLFLCLTKSSFGFLANLFGPGGLLQNFGGGRSIFGGQQPPNGVKQPGLTFDPPICRRELCVNYTVISSTQEYEHRRYEDLSVATTSVSSLFMGNLAMMTRLNRYARRGDNIQGDVFNMTYPILSPISSSNPNATMMFIIPTSNPPKPLSPLVTVATLPAMEIFVRKLPSGQYSMTSAEEVKAFKQILLTKGHTVTDEAYLAEFNPVFSFFDRYSELWLVSRYVSRVTEYVGVQPISDPLYQEPYVNPLV